MNEELPIGFSKEGADELQADLEKLKAALTEEEIRVLMYIQLHYSGIDEDKLPNQDQIEEEAKKKMLAAGLDIDDYGKYFQLKN